MAEIIWTSNTLTDLSEIGEYVATDSPKYAELLVAKLYHKVEILVTHENIGRKVPEVDKENLRELIEGNYRIIYEIVNNSVFILTVHHSSRVLLIKS